MKKYVCVSMSIVVMLVLALSVCPSAYANGGPGEGNDLHIGGNIKFTKTPDIVVVKEDLAVEIRPRTSTVKVVYTLKNNGSATDISYIFPVTRYISYMYDGAAVTKINFYDGSRKLTYKQTDEKIPKAAEHKQVVINGVDIYYEDILNTYYETKLHFAKDETKILTVEYDLKNSFTSFGTTKSLLSHYSDVLFVYDVSPAAVWGNGKAGEFNLSVNYKALADATSVRTNFKNFQRQSSGIYTYSEKNFDFAQAGQLSFAFEYPPFKYEEMKSLTQGSDILSRVYASSTLADKNSSDKNNRYSVKNLFDGSLDTAWATDKGVGEVIELEFEESMYVGIMNGYVKSKDVYYDNARIKKLKIETGFSDYVMDMPDTPYSEIDKNNPYKTISLCGDADGGTRYYKLTILEVYPGRKYNDVCVSAIYPMGWGTGTIVNKGYDVVDAPIRGNTAGAGLGALLADIDLDEMPAEPVLSHMDASTPANDKSPVSSLFLYIVVGIIVLAAGAGVVVFILRKKKKHVQS